MKILCSIFLIFLINISQSQEVIKFEFIGTIKTLDGSIVTYKLNFKILKNDSIEGYTISDVKGINQTKSTIKGILKLKEKTISFHEIENINTKSTAKKNEFCYVHVNNVVFNTADGITSIKGDFNGKFPNDSSCAAGEIYLVETKYLKKQLRSLKTLADSIKRANRKIAKTKKKVNIPKEKQNALNNNDTLEITWDSDVIILEFWDAQKFDQDKISIFVNEKKFLNNYLIKPDKKLILIPFIENSYTIKIFANNEGEYPPNTANIILRDGNKETAIVTTLKTGETTSIIITKK